MRCLIIDNYDSFTWNLADYVSQLFDEEPRIVRNDECTWSDLLRKQHFDCIVVSPGPGSVTSASDFGVSRDAVEQNDIPVLGVCLGLQGLAYAYAGRIEHAPVPYHGRLSKILHYGDPLFEGLPREFEAVRYHSLVVAAESVSSDLVVTARSECGLVMGLRHVWAPKWGVQFHPESILTVWGKRILANFRDLAHEHWAKTGKAVPRREPAAQGTPPANGASAAQSATAELLQVHARRLDHPVSAEAAFMKLFADSEHCFWLDSQDSDSGMARFSFMGEASVDGVLRCCLATATQSEVEAHLAALDQAVNRDVPVHGAELPFSFRGGYIGYWSYEFKEAFGNVTRHGNSIPDSLWLRADRFVAFDRESQSVWMVAAAEQHSVDAARRWLELTAARLLALRSNPPPPMSLGLDFALVQLDCSRARYLEMIRECKAEIKNGESYEVCLTTGFRVEVELEPLSLYRTLRKENAAPFGAYLRSGSTYILSTSPERFLKVEPDGTVQTKPIKGTCRRSSDPQRDSALAARLKASEKDRAENLMIVDLMRNDLRKTAEPGSVHVPVLMAIETFKTVHQLVSTIEARLRPGCSLVELLRSVFPGGSITGAPKLRTMEIIDRVEPAARGVYCGTIGYLGFGRVADLNIAIRTLSYDGKEIRFGAGGAITYLSDPIDEFDEIMLKAEAVLRPIWHYLSKQGSDFRCRMFGRGLVIEDRALESQPAESGAHP